MIEKSKYQFKFKGIFYNSCIELNNHLSLFKAIHLLNYKILSILHKSIHHINLKCDEENELNIISIVLRKQGIKPEDIDYEYLQRKKQNNNIKGYEEQLLNLAKYHQYNYTIEEKKYLIQSYKGKIKHLQNRINKLENDIKDKK